MSRLHELLPDIVDPYALLSIVEKMQEMKEDLQDIIEDQNAVQQKDDID